MYKLCFILLYDKRTQVLGHFFLYFDWRIFFLLYINDHIEKQKMFTRSYFERIYWKMLHHENNHYILDRAAK